MTKDWDFPSDPFLVFHDAGLVSVHVTLREVVINLINVCVYSTRTDDFAELNRCAVSIVFEGVTEIHVAGPITSELRRPFEDICVDAAGVFRGSEGLDFPATSDPMEITHAEFDLTFGNIKITASAVRVCIGEPSGPPEHIE